ncbi:hypothetical protein JHK87_050428 [Glycine soja]|nr:hypothetical protein JHK87_050428 [Glycine soja]
MPPLHLRYQPTPPTGERGGGGGFEVVKLEAWGRCGLLGKRKPSTKSSSVERRLVEVIYLENNNVLLKNKQKELKGMPNNLLQSRENFVNAYEILILYVHLWVVLDLDETLVCAYKTSSLTATLWTQAIEGYARPLVDKIDVENRFSL